MPNQKNIDQVEVSTKRLKEANGICFANYTGISVEKFLNKKSSGVLGGVLGATIGNTISDGAGALIDPTMNGMFVGIVIGALIPILFIPLIERIRNANT